MAKGSMKNHSVLENNATEYAILFRAIPWNNANQNPPGSFSSFFAKKRGHVHY